MEVFQRLAPFGESGLKTQAVTADQQCLFAVHKAKHLTSTIFFNFYAFKTPTPAAWTVRNFLAMILSK